MKLFSLETENFMLDGGAMFGVIPKSIWSKKYPANDLNLCNLSMRCLLIEINNRLILIDCGMGNTMPEHLLPYYYVNGDNTLINSLHKVGYSQEQITDVILSHLHFDHCGGAVTKHPDQSVTLTFPNAEIWLGKAQWEEAKNPNRREKPSLLKDNIEPLQNCKKLNLIDSTTSIIPEIELRIFNGHSVGQIIPIITYNNKKIVYTADLIPTASHIPISFVCGYDINPLLTMNETEEFLEEAVTNNYTFYFEHDVYVECCTLQKSPKGVIIDKTFTLQEFCS